jgi:hypothetical protein
MNTGLVTDLVIAALAAWQAIEIWRHGSIFAGLRARLELYHNFWTELLLCPFCLSPWVGLVTIMLVRQQAWYATWPMYALAIARLANLGNDFTYHYSRTPKTTFKDPLNDRTAGTPETPDI